MTDADLTKEQKGMLTHATGLDRSLKIYREHYCCQADSQPLNDLVARGLMTGPHRSSMLPDGSAYFYVSPAGKELAAALAKEPGA